jgi:hypothetical protein
LIDLFSLWIANFFPCVFVLSLLLSGRRHVFFNTNEYGASEINSLNYRVPTDLTDIKCFSVWHVNQLLWINCNYFFLKKQKKKQTKTGQWQRIALPVFSTLDHVIQLNITCRFHNTCWILQVFVILIRYFGIRVIIKYYDKPIGRVHILDTLNVHLSLKPTIQLYFVLMIQSPIKEIMYFL